jgi:MoxR-like ATPase
MIFLDIKPDTEVCLAQRGILPERVHVFDEDSIDAVNAALAAKRPLLVRGEPGIGKSQLARAVAKELEWAFVHYSVDAHCESRDLLWHFDAVQRLADAQLSKTLGETHDEIVKRLNVRNYLHPGPLWWVFNWGSALIQAGRMKISAPPQEEGGDPKKGCVLLIDEIDKAEMDVPNGLLEALGEGQFTPMGWRVPITASDTPSLVVITTNEERALPNAFLRRCLVLQLKLYDEKRPLVETLVKRGRAHFKSLHEEVLKLAAELLERDREAAKSKHEQSLPGQAEYLDLLRAIHELAPEDDAEQLNLLEQVARFVFNKQPDAAR